MTSSAPAIFPFSTPRPPPVALSLTSIMSGRPLGSAVRQRLTVSRNIGEHVSGRGLKRPSTMFFASASMLLVGNGGDNVAIWYKRHPMLQMSDFSLYGLLSIISGQE